jgi:hypothetical protein
LIDQFLYFSIEGLNDLPWILNKNIILEVIQTVQNTKCSTRSEPSSRTTLIGEQPNLWELLIVIWDFPQYQTIPSPYLSRHRNKP